MPYKRLVISSGHGKHIRGAAGILDEVDEARRVVERVADELREKNVEVKTFHDDTSHDQTTNLNTIVDFHNSQNRELDISVHFNAYVETTKPMGTECLYVTQSALAGQIAGAIAELGFIDRGPKKRTDLFFLNNTDKPAILIEVCFVDSVADANTYDENFDAICENIADVLGGDSAVQPPDPPPDMSVSGSCSWFGGPDDDGVSPSEGLAFISDVEQAPHLFLPYQPDGTSGLARRLNPYVHFIACRWDYGVTSKADLLNMTVQVHAPKTGITLTAFPADWGPNENTGRVADLSRGLLTDLGISTDDEVEVSFTKE